MPHYPCHLRKHRKQSQISQRLLAELLGYASQGRISQLEAWTQKPTIRVLIGCEIIFGAQAPDLFPELYAEARCTIREAAREILTARRRNMHLPEPAVGFLLALIERLEPRSPSHEATPL